MPESESELDVLLLAGRFEVRGRCTYTLRLAEGLGKKGIGVRVVTPDARLIDPGSRASLHIREFSRLDVPLWGNVVRHFLLHELRAQPPQLIHIQSRRALRLGNWLARRLERPCVLTVHEHPENRDQIRLDRDYCRQVIAVSDSVRDDLIRRLGLPPDLVTVIPSGVETELPEKLVAPLEAGRVPVVGTAGPLEAVKGFPYFLGAARQVLEIRPAVEFLVAGAGPEEANLRRLARELGISDKVTFVPYVFGFTESLAATDIFCLPSLQQGLGTIMLEAMALGRPVIATGVGGIGSVIRHGETGLIVPPENSGDLAKRILELLDQPTRARSIGARARQLAIDNYNVEMMVDKTTNIYRTILPALIPA